jgi:hypothetical protein
LDNKLEEKRFCTAILLWNQLFVIPQQNSGEYNLMYQLVYDQQVMLHPTKSPDLHPHPQAQ